VRYIQSYAQIDRITRVPNVKKRSKKLDEEIELLLTNLIVHK
jgi:hypothetical protein